MSTIVALATPRGRGALGIIRLSGPQAFEIANAITSGASDIASRRVVLRKVNDPLNGAMVDEALLTYFEAPHSLTGEDVIEISCHGSPAVLSQVVNFTLSLGARLAGPGEFTLRALSNGKVNLSQAEAIRDLISAQTEAAAKQAARQLNGELSLALEPLKKKLIEVIVILESAIEFVEDDLPAPQWRAIESSLDLVLSGIEGLRSSYQTGRLLQEGIKVAITGRPNVGKSSLFNRLVGRDRAIVAEMPGTTRDTLSEAIDITGVPVVFTDTAGVRETIDGIERLGIERTRSAISESDLVIVVIDGSEKLRGDDEDLLLQTESVRRLVVLNKCDLPSFSKEQSMNGSAINVSAITGEGLGELRAAILDRFDTAFIDTDGLLVTNARHYQLLVRTKQELDEANVALKDRCGEEVVLVSLHNSLNLLGEITGETTTEDILSSIFSTFCIGK